MFHPKGGFELTLFALKFKGLGIAVKGLVFVVVNSFVTRLATVLLQVYNVLSLISLLVCMTVRLATT